MTTAAETGIAAADKKSEKTPPPSSFETAAGTGAGGDHGNAAVNLLDDALEITPMTQTGDTVEMIKKGSKLSQCEGRPTFFKYSGDKAEEVYVCGTFSNWEKIPMVWTQKNFFALVDLLVGDHQFKYCVDNEWANDKFLPLEENDQGSQNNVISIKQEDRREFDEETYLAVVFKGDVPAHVKLRFFPSGRGIKVNWPGVVLGNHYYY